MITVIIAAAGESGRMKKTGSKITAEIAGAPVIIHALSPLEKIPRIHQIIVAALPGDSKKTRSLLNEFGFNGIEIIHGGKCRSETIAKALNKVSSDSTIVAIHDAARPCASARLWKDVIAAAKKYGAAIPAIPVTDTIKSTVDGFIKSTVPRDGLYLAQTPQVFKTNIIKDAYRNAGSSIKEYTDDASIVEASGGSVAIIAGEKSNIKITFDADLLIAECLILSSNSTDC